MLPAVESTPHSNAMIYNSTYEGAELITKFMDADSDDTEARRNLAKVQTGQKFRCDQQATSFFRPVHGQRLLKLSVGRRRLPSLSGSLVGENQSKAKTGISMAIRHLQLQHRRLPKKVGKERTA